MHHIIRKTEIAVITDYDMVQQSQAERGQGIVKLPRELDVSLARIRVPARMVVGENDG